MRLINADELITTLLEEIPMAENTNIFKDMIKNQPTAYDVDKVVNQLEKNKFIDCETVLSDVHQGYNAGLSRAIDIVKAGGLDER